MRSISKYLGYFVFISFLTSLLILFSKSETQLMVGQLLLVILILFLAIFVEKRKQKSEEELREKIGKIDDVDYLRELREKNLSYISKADITRRILELSYSKEETEILKSYATRNEDMVFYYARLIQNEREDREIYKEKRGNFKKAYKNKPIVYPDFMDNVKETVKWLVFFIVGLLLYYFQVFSFIPNKLVADYLNQMLFLMDLGIIINLVFWLMRASKAHALKGKI